jgi:periplasmic divalent cation tolerance protein
MTVQLLFCTCPDTATAERIADTLVGRGLAACVSILPGLTSVYRWQDAVERSSEVLLLIKSTSERYPALEVAVRELHPYELPELIAVEADAGLPPYLAWVVESASA